MSRPVRIVLYNVAQLCNTLYMSTVEAITKIQTVLSQFSYTASVRSETEIALINRKRELCGIISLTEPVVLKVRFEGQKTMMGSLVKNPICVALGCVSGRL